MNCVKIYSDVFVPYLPTFFFCFRPRVFVLCLDAVWMLVMKFSGKKLGYKSLRRSHLGTFQLGVFVGK